MRAFLRAKIHKATVTDANLGNTSGARLETYVIVGEANSGIICMNGAASHLIKAGEEIIIMAFEYTDIPPKPKSILVDKDNRLIKYIEQ